MNGIQIEIMEDNNKPDSFKKLNDVIDHSDITNSYIDSSFDSDTFVAKQIDYQENYLIVDLKKIADYYDIPTRKLKKDQLIQEIVLFESDPTNTEIYLKRIQYWYWLKELKEDRKLKNYILF